MMVDLIRSVDDLDERAVSAVAFEVAMMEAEEEQCTREDKDHATD